MAPSISGCCDPDTGTSMKAGSRTPSCCTFSTTTPLGVTGLAVVCWSGICGLGSIEIGSLGPPNTLPFDHKSGSPESLVSLLPDMNNPPSPSCLEYLGFGVHLTEVLGLVQIPPSENSYSRKFTSHAVSAQLARPFASRGRSPAPPKRNLAAAAPRSDR